MLRVCGGAGAPASFRRVTGLTFHRREEARLELSLIAQQRGDPPVDRVVGHEPQHGHGPRLPEAVRAGLCLLVFGRNPV